MTMRNQWFGKVKSRVKLAQETAKTKIEKITVTIDKKLKEAQEEIEKYGIVLLFEFVLC